MLDTGSVTIGFGTYPSQIYSQATCSRYIAFFVPWPSKATHGSITLAPAWLENSTRPLVFTSASGCMAGGNFYISSVNQFFPICANIFVMQGKCLFSDLSKPIN